MISTNLAHANVVSSNSEFGTDSVTLDTTQGLMFLDMTITRGLSRNQVVADAQYADWRYASIEEVRALWINAGLEDWDGTEFSGPGNNEAVSTLIDLVGPTGIQEIWGGVPYPRSIGMTSDLVDGEEDRYWASLLFTGPLSTQYGATVHLLYADEPSPNVAHWLVRQIPTPGTTSIVPLMLIVGFRRRR